MTEQLWLFALVGFVAQFVKGSIGMGFGVISSSALLTLGLPPVIVSASVHTAEVGSTAASALSHIFFRNVDFVLLRRLVIPGMITSMLGAYVLTQLPIRFARPYIAVYLLILGVVILYKGVHRLLPITSIRGLFTKHIIKHELPSDRIIRGVLPLASIGGFLDAVGGGGWGHIVTSTLLARDATPHYAIGTVNTAQFFIAISSSVTFFLAMGVSHLPIILAILAGGVVASPLAAYMVRRIHPNLLTLFAGVLVVTLSTRTLIKVLF